MLWFCRKLSERRSTFWISNGTHGPLRGLIVAVFIVSAWTWELDAIEFDVASRSGELDEGGCTPRPMWAVTPLLWIELVSTKSWRL